MNGDPLPVTIVVAVVDDVGIIALFADSLDAIKYAGDRAGTKVRPAAIQGWTTVDVATGDGTRRLGR